MRKCACKRGADKSATGIGERGGDETLALGVAGCGGVWWRREERLTLRINEQEEEEGEKRL